MHEHFYNRKYLLYPLVMLLLLQWSVTDIYSHDMDYEKTLLLACGTADIVGTRFHDLSDFAR